MQSSSYRTSTVVNLFFVCLCSNAVIFPGKVDGIAAVLAPYRNVESRLTIIARADGTFDIKEFPQRDRWFAPEAVGTGLVITGERRFGKAVKPSSVDVLVKADAGASDEAIKAALSSARASGFTRFGFVDPRLGEVVKRFATYPPPAAPLALERTRQR